MSVKIAVLAENIYEDLEAWYPILRFREAGAEVVVIDFNRRRSLYIILL